MSSSRGDEYTRQNDDDDVGSDSYGSFGRVCMYIGALVLAGLIVGIVHAANINDRFSSLNGTETILGSLIGR